MSITCWSKGTERARVEARADSMAAKKAMGLTGVWSKIRRSDEKRSKRLAKAAAS